MKKLLMTTVLLFGLQLSNAQYFDGSHPGIPLLGRNGPLDGGAVTNVSTTNLVGIIQIGNIGSINASNLTGSIGASLTGDISGMTNLPALTVTTTNFISGAFYTNQTGHFQVGMMSCKLIGAAVAGAAQLDWNVTTTGFASTNPVATYFQRASLGTLVTVGLPATNAIELIIPIPPNAVYWATNTSAGTGNSATIVAGTGTLQTWP